MATKALVVDNNPVVLRAISAILEQEGCDVKSAPNGLEALNLLKSYTPDVVFTDLVMPHVDGEQLCKIIRNNKKLCGIFLVVVSGIALDDFTTILEEKYYDLCITKGNLKEMRLHIREALRNMGGLEVTGGRILTSADSSTTDEQLPSTLTEELLTEKRHLNCILENLAEGIAELNTGGVVVSINNAAKRILEVKEGQIIGTHLSEYPWGDKQKIVEEWLEKSLPDPDGDTLEVHEDFPIKVGGNVVTASFIPVRHENASFGLCIFRDITRQYRAEEHERELDNAIKLVTKMEAMSCMAGGIAHDFNNMLTVICGNLDILTHVGSANISEDHTQLIQHARSAAYMAVDLTRKISHSSPFGIVTRQKHVFEQIVKDTVARFVIENRESISLDCPVDGSIVSVNPDQIAAALSNILTNAIEAGGRDEVQVVTRNVVFQRPVIFSGQYVPAGTYVCLTVRDFGNGIEPVNLLKVFDPYFSTKARGASKGIGLGLTVVYATMRNHGGYVVVESEIDVGTTVSCYLPCYGNTETGQPKSTLASERKKSVLFIENDFQSQEVGRIMLEYIGHEVVIADNFQHGLATLDKRICDSENSLQVVMIDVSQESAGDHRTICNSFHERDHSLKIIITGGSMLDPVMSDCKKYGYAAALPKPFTLDSLKHVLMTVHS